MSVSVAEFPALSSLESETTLFLFYKGWLIRDGKMGLVGILENLRDGD